MVTLARKLGPILLLFPLVLGACESDDRNPVPQETNTTDLLSAPLKGYAVRLARKTLETYFEVGEDAASQVTVEEVAGLDSAPVPRLFVTLRNKGYLRAS